MRDKRFHEFTEEFKKSYFNPIHEWVWDAYLSWQLLDGQSVFYYTMEYIARTYPELCAKDAFDVARDIMTESWELYYDRLEAIDEMKVEGKTPELPLDDELPW